MVGAYALFLFHWDIVGGASDVYRALDDPTTQRRPLGSHNIELTALVGKPR